MRLNIFKYCIIIAITWAISSCKKNFLTETNPNEISTGTYWQTLQETNSGLTSVYNSLLNESILSIIQEGVRSDMGYPGYGRPIPTGHGEYLQIYAQLITSSTPFVAGKWNACYKTIFWANQVIEALNRIKPTLTGDQQTTWSTQMGQARFIRGLMHFYLHSSYNNGNVIIRDKVPVTTADFNKPVSPSDSVIKFFRADLLYAYQNLPVKYIDPQDLGRATKGAAATIIGTSYLYQKDYTDAMPYFNDVITNPDYGYELVKDMSLLFTTKGEFNNESIFELAYNTQFNTDISVWNDAKMSNQLAYNTTKNTGCVMPAWIIYAYKTEPMDTTDARNYIPDPSAPSGKKLRNLPLRCTAMAAIVEDSSSTYYKTASTTQNAKFTSNGWGFGYYKKYSNYDIETSEGENDPRGARSSGKNVVVLRLAEVYLMQAECLIKTGDIPGAIEMINAVRHRWALELYGPGDATFAGAEFDGKTYTAETLMNQLMYIDKPLEMSVEGQAIRWNDLRRWGIIESNFKTLAGETFYAVDFPYIDNTGKAQIKKQASVVKVNPGGATGNAVINYEYNDASINFNPGTEAYLPLPLQEDMTNSSIR